ncbi:quinone oxidoreductase family protein [Streptomyces sp. SP18CS02]|uniref:quinone oxidoreductase family protein n=1 Tax=Streptomyces sp. SP18CS02 TaxID=3002531 RepID=UPI002E766963|nr:zinc-binding dehydrogenase [Streptomyces sp. SP18CS02]MEE1756671.1 zinc-binding dehydrogenase [Streptomyces sp. SP18CS02]
MRIVRHHEYGPSGVLRTEEADLPAYGPQDVLVRAEAIGVDHADVQRRLGTFPLGAPSLPHCPSTDVSGTVVEVGAEVAGITPGMRVTVWKARDAYAEYVAAPAARVLPIPAGLDPAEATILGATGRVAINLLRTARLAAGETVLVHAGAGAVGHIAVQVARALGAGKVLATAGSPAKLDFIRSLGADAAIDYTAPDWTERVAEAAGTGGVDVILDGIGGKQLVTDIHLLAPYGRLVFFGGSGGDAEQPDIPVLDLLGMRQVMGFSMPTLLQNRPDLAEEAVRDLVRMVSEGSVRPVIHARVPLDEAPHAHDLLERRQSMGRVVLVP